MSQPALTPTEFSSAVTAITSAFGDPTRREIYLFVHERSQPTETDEHGTGVTAGEVAERFVLHPNVARHHLDKLSAGGYVEVATGRNGSGAGRPSKRYRVTAPEMTLELPVRHDDLLVTLLGKALSLLPNDQAEAMAEEVGLQYGKSMAAAMGGTDHSADAATGAAQRSFQSALHTVADALTAHGFAAHAERHGDGLRIVSDHCPFGGAAIEHPVICAVDRGLVRGMLGAIYGQIDTAIAESRPMGDAKCITSIS
ncbi:MAG: helix-turn-helix domain-containing protein [Acidimicrobiales bacterium]